MNDRLIIHDDADKTPPAAPGRHPLAPISGADFPRRSGVRLPAQAWIILTLVCVLPVLLLLWGAYSAVQSLLLDAPWLSSVMGALLLLLAAVGLVGLVGTLAARGWVSVQQARVIRTAHGAPVDVVAAMRVDPLIAEAQQIQLRMAEAPYLQYPNLSTMSVPKLEAARAETPLLPAPIDVGPVAPDVWLGWLNLVPHVMLAAETGGGKTTTALHLLAPRLANGEQVYIIDPNASGWGGLPSIGGGEDWPAVARAMNAVIAMYTQRQQQRQQHLERTRRELPHDAFGRLTVILDEAYMARAALDTGKESVWRRFVPILGSGARKVGISVILLTQTTNVEDLGISAPLRENYTRLALDSAAARKLVQAEEPDKARKSALLGQLAGLQYPAVTERMGQCLLLDRSGFDATPDLTRYGRQVWAPQMACQQTAKPSISVDELLIRAVRAGKTRDETRATFQAKGLGFKDVQWTQAREFVLRERLDTAEAA